MGSALRLSVLLGLVHKVDGEIANLIIHCFHPFGIKRAGIFDLLLSNLTPARHHGAVVCVGRPAMDHVTRSDFIQ